MQHLNSLKKRCEKGAVLRKGGVAKRATSGVLPVISGLSGYHQIIHGINFDMELFLYGYPFCTPRIILVAFGPAESDESMTVKIRFCDLPINVKIPVVVFIIFSL